MKRILTFFAAAFMLAACATSSAAASGQSGALQVAPLRYTMRTLPNGLARLFDAGRQHRERLGAGLVRRRLGRRSRGPLRLRAPLRTHHVQGDAQYAVRSPSIVSRKMSAASTTRPPMTTSPTITKSSPPTICAASCGRKPSVWARSSSTKSTFRFRARCGERRATSAHSRPRPTAACSVSSSAKPIGRRTRMAVRASARSTISTRPPSPTCARSTRPTIARTTPCSSSPGNFNEAELNQWVDQYFGGIARPNRPIPRDYPTEPAHGPREYTTYAPNVPLPAIVVSYPQPAATDPSIPALIVLDAIMSNGDSSRLYHPMVYDQQTRRAGVHQPRSDAGRRRVFARARSFRKATRPTKVSRACRPNSCARARWRRDASRTGRSQE